MNSTMESFRFILILTGVIACISLTCLASDVPADGGSNLSNGQSSLLKIREDLGAHLRSIVNQWMDNTEETHDKKRDKIQQQIESYKRLLKEAVTKLSSMRNDSTAQLEDLESQSNLTNVRKGEVIGKIHQSLNLLIKNVWDIFDDLESKFILQNVTDSEIKAYFDDLRNETKKQIKVWIERKKNFFKANINTQFANSPSSESNEEEKKEKKEGGSHKTLIDNEGDESDENLIGDENWSDKTLDHDDDDDKSDENKKRGTSNKYGGSDETRDDTENEKSDEKKKDTDTTKSDRKGEEEYDISDRKEEKEYDISDRKEEEEYGISDVDEGDYKSNEKDKASAKDKGSDKKKEEENDKSNELVNEDTVYNRYGTENDERKYKSDEKDKYQVSESEEKEEVEDIEASNDVIRQALAQIKEDKQQLAIERRKLSEKKSTLSNFLAQKMTIVKSIIKQSKKIQDMKKKLQDSFSGELHDIKHVQSLSSAQQSDSEGGHHFHFESANFQTSTPEEGKNAGALAQFYTPETHGVNMAVDDGNGVHDVDSESTVAIAILSVAVALVGFTVFGVVLLRRVGFAKKTLYTHVSSPPRLNGKAKKVSLKDMGQAQEYGACVEP